MTHNLLKTLAQNTTPFEATPFDQLQSADFQPAIEEAVGLAKHAINEIKNNDSPATFANTIEALEFSSKPLDHATTVFFNLFSASSDDILIAASGPISQVLAEYSNDIQLDDKLFSRIKELYEKKETLGLNKEQDKLLRDTYIGFARNGALLSHADKETLRAIDQEQAQAGPEFGNNLLQATNAFSMNITDEAELAGLPLSARDAAKEEAEKRKDKGWTFTLHAPSFLPFLKYSEQRELRKKMWMAYGQKAFIGENSNKELCSKIAKLRNQRAQLLGYPTHAHFVLEKRMAKTPEQVVQFLEEVKTPSFNAAKKEMSDLKSFIKNELHEDIELQPWDFSYYSEKYKRQLFDLNEEELRAYFPLEAVKEGIFIHGEKLYGLNFKLNSEIPSYHKDVEVYEVHRQKDFIGLLYLDFFPRDNKRAGAWMTSYRDQGFDGQDMKRPHISIVCNFTKPTKDKPSLLTFNEVQTLFHEYGHALHGLLSDCYYPSLGGTNVLWDFVELPSQIMENWTFEKESLDIFAKHYDSNEKIPEELVKKLKDSANFQAGYASTRQVGFAMVDMNWHSDISGKSLDPTEMERAALAEVQLLPFIEDTNFSVSFSHIFAGGYSAGYYSYKWAEVLDADAFEYFKETGIFNQETANKFYKEVLSKGGTEDPKILYKNFRGRDPDPKALLRRSGLI